MRYIMSLDGGGTKLNCLIADGNGNLVGVGKGGPTNPNYISRVKIEEAVIAAISGALVSSGVDKNDICLVHVTMITGDQWVIDAIKKLLYEKVPVRFFNEMDISLYGAIQEDYGAVVLSGTGSFASAHSENNWVIIGGWGDVLGDEGSGYYIGHKALKVCAQIEDGSIPHSMIMERVLETYKIRSIREMVAVLNNAPLGQQRVMIASACPIVGWCADHGDVAAIDIIKKAAFHLARQLRTAVSRCGQWEIPVTVSGGAWKTTSILFSTFKEELLKELPVLEVRAPLFEPVVGGILLGLRDMGFPVKENIEFLKKSFASFAYSEVIFNVKRV